MIVVNREEFAFKTKGEYDAFIIIQSKMERKRIYTIDLIKFLAACCIACHHYQQLLDVRFSGLNFFGGYFGFENLVELFFIISGFVTARNNFYSVGKSKDYFLHIIYRIYPMAMIATISTALLEYGYYKKYDDYFWGVVPSLWRLINSLLLTFSAGVIKIGLGIINPLWFLCVLLICHVIYIYMIYISTKNKYNLLYLWIICILTGESALQYGISLPFYNASMGRGVSSFFVGVVLWEVCKNNKSNRLIVLSVLALFTVALTYRFEYSLYADGQRGVLTYIAFPSLIIVLSRIDNLIPHIIGQIFSFMGGISYEIFLWHFAGILMIDFLNRGSLAIDTNSREIMIVFLLAVIVFSSSVYLFIEKPIAKSLVKQKHQTEIN